MTVLDLQMLLTELPVRETRTGVRHRVATLHHSKVLLALGVARLTTSSSERFWEIHDEGDELLVVLRGQMEFDIEDDDGSRTTETVRAGEAIHIPCGRAHAGRVIEDVDVLFLTPSDGSRMWESAPRSLRGDASKRRLRRGRSRS
jgi:mannose-6-phosphate isomerase-like protein (cupin superfamily)